MLLKLASYCPGQDVTETGLIFASGPVSALITILSQEKAGDNFVALKLSTWLVPTLGTYSLQSIQSVEALALDSVVNAND